MIVFLLFYNIGANQKMSIQEAENLKKQFGDKIKDIDAIGIFFNNFGISSVMFIPGFGVATGIFSGYGTGLVFSALSITDKSLENVSPFSILITPFGIMEVLAYGIAMSRSGLIIYERLVKKIPLRQIVRALIIEIIIVLVILLAAAFIEWEIIKEFGKITDS